MKHILIIFAVLLLAPLAALHAADAPSAATQAAERVLYEQEFSQTAYGRTPMGWRDLVGVRPSRNWAVDGEGFLRQVIKNKTGLLVYDGYTAELKPARALADGRIIAEFKKVEDETVSLGIAGRVRDRDNYYLARFAGTQRLELLLVKTGVETALDFVAPVGTKETRPTGRITLRRYREGETVADSDSAGNEAMKPITDEPGLPRVLLIGDSISIGYTLSVREKLKGKANVHRIPQNGGATEVGLEKMKAWLGDGKWDVIHFNFGLHDAKYCSATTQRTSREQYADNLRKLVTQMKATGAKLIFATTTPVPKGGVLSPTRKFDGIEERNGVALQVMRENGVTLNDLYSAVLPVQEKVGRPNDVHYQPEGYEVLATAVAASIQRACCRTNP
ncbi:MAG TPA: SGNH/GDSL hydrolase family protein [Thermoguttaceae bacterium]|nr:SGNH/GDSL hydrolase family protein [Thermoguttaceae bacterium]